MPLLEGALLLVHRQREISGSSTSFRREPTAKFIAVTYLLSFDIVPEKEARSLTNPMVKSKSV